MLKEALELVQKTALDAAKFNELEIDDPRQKTFSKQGGQVFIVAVPPPLRMHVVHTVDDFIAAVNHPWPGLGTTGPAIWHDDDFLTLILDDADRRDLVRLPLSRSAQYTTLADLSIEETLSQAQLLSLLRIALAGCVADGPALIGKLRQVKFVGSDAAASNLQRGKESMDFDVQREVQGLDDLAELVQVSINVYDNPGELDSDARISIACALDPHIGEKAFVFAPLPGELTIATQQAQADIRARIMRGCPEIPIFNGRP